MKKLHSKRRVIADLSSLEMWASAPTKMATKRIKRIAIDVRQDTAFPLNEAAEMDGGSKVSTGAGRRVSVAYPSRSRLSANASMCGPLIPPLNRLSVLGAEKYFSNMVSPCVIGGDDPNHSSRRSILMVS